MQEGNQDEAEKEIVEAAYGDVTLPSDRADNPGPRGVDGLRSSHNSPYILSGPVRSSAESLSGMNSLWLGWAGGPLAEVRAKVT